MPRELLMKKELMLSWR